MKSLKAAVTLSQLVLLLLFTGSNYAFDWGLPWYEPAAVAVLGFWTWNVLVAQAILGWVQAMSPGIEVDVPDIDPEDIG